MNLEPIEETIKILLTSPSSSSGDRYLQLILPLLSLSLCINSTDEPFFRLPVTSQKTDQLQDSEDTKMSRSVISKAKIYIKTEDFSTTDGLSQTKDLSQTTRLFRKYLHAKAQPNIGKTNMEESEDIKRKSPPAGHCLAPPLFGCNFSRHPSLLEQKLLPAIGGDPTEANSVDAETYKEQQLTIFYGGTVHVHDNVPADKAEAIMLLAGEINLSKPKPESNPPLQLFNLESLCKLRADLPIARKLSLQHFLEKRRQRIVNKSPYHLPLDTKHNKKKEATENNSNEGSKVNQSLSLSPFPSRLGSFFPVSTNKAVQG